MEVKLLERKEILTNLKTKKYDVLVIGGGVIGASIACLSSLQGLSVILIEEKDYCFGASSKSTKIIHGNMYMINRKNIGEARLSISSRNKIAEMTHADIIPILHLIAEGSSVFKKHDIRAFIYETLSLYKMPFHRFLTKSQAKKTLPFLDTKFIEGILEYYEYRINDIRYVFELIYQAKKRNADILNHMKCIDFDESQGEIKKVIAKDMTTMNTYEIEAKHIVNASGHFLGSVNSMLKNKMKEPEIDFVKSTNIYVREEKVSVNAFISLEDIDFASKIDILPFKENISMISMSDKRNYGNQNCVYSSNGEIEYMLEMYNKYFSAHIGVRDIINTESAIHTQNKLAFGIREHNKYNYYSVDGGSITLSEAIAESVVSNFCTGIKRFKKPIMNKYLNRKTNCLSEESRIFIIFYFGYSDILDRIEEMCLKNPELAQTVTERQIPIALIRYFALEEDAITLNDMMRRRFQFHITEDDYGILTSEIIAKEMAKIYKWSEKRMKNEINDYINEIKRGRTSLY